MRYLSEYGTWIIGGIGSAVSFIAGHTDQALHILVGVMVIDIISGLLKGAHQKRLKSAIMGMGILKKGAILLSIVFAYLLDLLVNQGEPVFVTMMTWLAIGNEGLSITENFAALGVGVPKVVTDRLGIMKDQAEEIQKDKDRL